MEQKEHADQQAHLEKILGVTAKETGDAASEEASSLAVGGGALQELWSAYADARIRCRAEVEAAYEAVFDKIADAPVDLRPVKETIEALDPSEPGVVMAAIGAEIVARQAKLPRSGSPGHPREDISGRTVNLPHRGEALARVHARNRGDYPAAQRHC